MKRLVCDVIADKKLKSFASIDPDAPIIDALKCLKEKNADALVVLQNGSLVGIFSENDFIKAVTEGELNLYLKVKNVMTKKVYYVHAGYTLEDCLQVMSKVKVSYLPIVDNDRVIALISMRNIMEILVEEQEDQINHLLTYITGHDSGLEHIVLNNKNIQVLSTKPTNIQGVL